jgi:hypothetical protein
MPMALLPVGINSSVSTSRAGVAKLVNQPAHRYPPQVVYTPDGEIVNTKYKLDFPVDVVEGDSVTELGRPTGIVKLVDPHPTGITSTDILVTRSLT